MGLNILPIFGRSQEKDALELFKQLVEKLKVMRERFAELNSLFLEGDYKKVEECSIKISEVELEVDIITRSIIKSLYEGAFLPDMRSSLFSLTNKLDDVADSIEDVGKYTIYLRDKTVSTKIKEKIDALFKTVPPSIELLEKALTAILNDDGKFEFFQDVRKVEHEADILKKEIFDIILFDKKLDHLSSRVILQLANLIETISDHVEECADRIQMLRILRGA
ncbi:DUF47 family protein [Candidatus Woesearchaeota archaeon]|nr:DUF47 family protein [Candidatus Woesearchaeota archaeon]